MPADTPLWFRLLAGIPVGLALGSFTTMLAYRIPRRISIIRPPSHCPSCNTPLKPRDLVPVVSWLAEKGHCRHCHKPIGARYLLIELITALGCVAVFVGLGFQLALIPALVAVVTFVALAAINNVKD